LHYLQFSKGSKRRSYGGTISKGIKKGTLIRDVKYGLCYVGGEDQKGVSLCSYSTGKRVVRNRKVEKVKTKVGYVRVSHGTNSGSAAGEIISDFKFKRSLASYYSRRKGKNKKKEQRGISMPRSFQCTRSLSSYYSLKKNMQNKRKKE
jgi:ribosomal protein S6E (S10)